MTNDSTLNSAAEEDNPNWEPIVGSETTAFLQSAVPLGAREEIQNSALEILSKGIPPTADVGQQTGLIVGYVQSGKTMSFEAATALACDNGFQIVIVLAGTSTNLLDQSTTRLQRDLRLDEERRTRRWVQFKNPSNDDATVESLRNLLEDWRDPNTQEEYRQTALITVLKQHQRLQNLISVLDELNLHGVPVLIIDDEADQASLNTQVNQGEESTTYSRLIELKQMLPNHTYLQYTATPQAPLLINIIDALSPNFVKVLEPGEDYVGGRDFFAGNSPLVRVIPQQDVSTSANPLTSPPESLLQALRIFMVGVAVGISESRNSGNRSMLVHPSHTTISHQEYYGWVRDIFEEWKTILNLPATDPDRLELIEDFREAYDDVAETVGTSIPSFEEIARSFSFAFRRTQVLEVNAREGQTPRVNWRDTYGWILVGGQAMDRGFTVEGLTVTYMPRGVGVGNADTIQQRARFFGYKRRYLGYCRVYLEQGTLDAFNDYVEHEEDIRDQLQAYEDSNRPLNEWKRAFLLDMSLRPCRETVLDLDYMKGRISDAWITPQVVLAADNILEENRSIVRDFLQDLIFVDDVGHTGRTATQRHQILENVPLLTVLQELLALLRVPGIIDSQRHTGLLLQLRKAVETNPDEVCTIYKMSPTEQRERGVNTENEITNIFQGEYPVHPRNLRGTIYPGDRMIRSHENVTIQIYSVNLTRENAIVARNVAITAVWVPSRLARSWVSQHQPEQ